MIVIYIDVPAGLVLVAGCPSDGGTMQTMFDDGDVAGHWANDIGLERRRCHPFAGDAAIVVAYPGLIRIVIGYQLCNGLVTITFNVLHHTIIISKLFHIIGVGIESHMGYNDIPFVLHG